MSYPSWQKQQSWESHSWEKQSWQASGPGAGGDSNSYSLWSGWKRPAPADNATEQGKPKQVRPNPAIATGGSLGLRGQVLGPPGNPAARAAGNAAAGGNPPPWKGATPAEPSTGSTAVPSPQASPAAPTAPKMDKYIVYCSDGNPQQEVVLATLVGDFNEKGQNHGRKVYQKTRAPAVAGFEEVDVLLYYWDGRDGPAFEGWWFGNKLGGTQVWSHCKSSSKEPPGHGWQIPWDGAVAPTLCIENKEVQEHARAENEVYQLSQEVSQAEFAAREALHQATAMAPADAEADALAAASESFDCLAEAARLIAPKVALISDLGRKVAPRVRDAAGEHKVSFQNLSTQLREVHQELVAELRRIRALHEKVQERVNVLELEEADRALMSEIMPKATARTNSAEDLSQTANIVSEMIYENAEDQDQVWNAIDQTENAVTKSQIAISEARIYLYSKRRLSKKLAATVQAETEQDFSKLLQQLLEAQQRVAPLKTVREEFEVKCKAQQKAEEASSKVALAEVDLDKAEELILKLDDETLDQEAVQDAKQSLQIASDHVNKAREELDEERVSASGLVLEELRRITPRLDECHQRVRRLQTMLKEAGEKSTTSVVLGEAAEKVTAVTGVLYKLDEIECRLQADDQMGIEDVLALVAEAETLATGAQSSTSMARMFIQMKALEVKRLTGAAGQQATQQLQEYTREIEAASKRLQELKTSVIRRKRQALLQEVRSEVTSVEARVERVIEAASLLSDDAELMQLSSAAIREAGDKASAEDKAATDLIAEVKKSIVARQIEAKGKDATPEVSAELLKLNSRLTAATAELTKQRKLFTGVHQRIIAKRILEETEQKMQEMENKVAKTAAAMAHYGPEGQPDGEKKPKDSETNFAEATLAVRSMSRHIETQSRAHQGFAAEALSKLEPRVQAAKDRLEASSKAMRENVEKGAARGILNECEVKIVEMERILQKAADAEQPFLLEEELAPAEAKSKNAELEKAIQAASAAVTDTKVLLKMKGLNARRMTDTAAKSTGEALQTMIGTVDAAAKKIAEMRSRFTEYKNSAIRRQAKPKAKFQ